MLHLVFLHLLLQFIPHQVNYQQMLSQLTQEPPPNPQKQIGKKKKKPKPQMKIPFSKPQSQINPPCMPKSLPLELPSTTSDQDSREHEDEMRKKRWRCGLTRRNF